MTNENNNYPNLKYFIERASYFPINLGVKDINFEFGFFIALDTWIYAHNAGLYAGKSLITKSIESRNYIQEAINIFEEWDNLDEDSSDSKKVTFYNEHEVVDDIYTRLGNPPNPCTPLYFISYMDPTTEIEKLVYIGKTNTNSNRFRSGHAALTKLLHPKYSIGQKKIYFGTVMFLSNDGYIPLEFLEDEKELALLLTQIESTLIAALRPELNTDYKLGTRHKISSQVHIQNTTSNFLNDKFIGLQ